MYELRSDHEQLFNLSFNQVVHPPSPELDLTIVRGREYATVHAAGRPDAYPIIAAEGRGPRALGAAALPETLDPELLELELAVELAVTYPEEPEAELPEDPDDDNESSEAVAEETPDEPAAPGDAANPPKDPPKPPLNGGATDGEGEWDEDNSITGMLASGLPRVERETIRAMRASLADDSDLRSRIVKFTLIEQPRLMRYIEDIALNHASSPGEAAALVEKIAVLYCLLAAQNVASNMDKIYGFGISRPEQ